MELERGLTHTHVHPARRREVARRQALQQRRREVHMGLLTGKSEAKLRKNPRKSWYLNVREITTNGPTEVAFQLANPEPSLLAMLAAGFSPVYPCHMNAAQMRTHPIGTGPFRFVELKQNESMRVERNPYYWKAGRPYLDGIEFSIIPNRSTAILAFVAGKFDMTFTGELPAGAGEGRAGAGAESNLRHAADQHAGQSADQLRPARHSTMRASARRWGWRSTARRSPTSSAAAIDKLGGAMMPPPEGQWGYVA